MQSTRACLAALFAAALLCLLAAGNAQAVRSVTGISYQGTNQDLPPAAQAYANAMGSKFQQARLIVPWNVAQLPAGHWARQEMQRFYDNHVGRKELLVSLNVYNVCEDQVAAGNLSPCTPTAPSAAALVSAFGAFRTAWPQVRQFTAWNEPNHTVQGRVWNGSAWSGTNSMSPTAAQAAEYFVQVHGVCATTGTCTVYAGDFADGDSMGAYPDAYKRAIGGIVPAAWAVHPYVAVNTGLTRWLTAFYSDIAGGRPVWFTEVGVKVCANGLSWVNEADQAARAQAMSALLSRYDPTRTYYYMIAGNTNAAGCASNPVWDSGLVNLDGSPRPALHELFPEVSGARPWSLRNDLSAGVAQQAQWFLAPGRPIAGDWDGDGYDTPGTFDPLTGWWHLTNSRTSVLPQMVFVYGGPGDLPIAGDWDGNGRDSIGVVRGNLWFMRNDPSSGPNDYGFQYGDASHGPVVGDWDGDGDDTPGVIAGAAWFLRNANSTGVSDIPGFTYGNSGDRHLVGDWNGDGSDTIGVISAGTANWFLRNANSSGASDVPGFMYGNVGDQPVVGDWNNDNKDSPGVVQ